MSRLQFAVLSGAVCACAAIFPGATARGGIIVTSLEQDVSVMVGTASDDDSHSGAPPLSFIGADRTVGNNFAEAFQIVFPTYVGPPGTSAELSLPFRASVLIDLVPAGNSTAEAESLFSMTFALDTAHPYSFSSSSAAFTSFIGPSGAVAVGTGTLAPGDYAISNSLFVSGTSFANQVANFNLAISPAQAAAVPEPSSLALLITGIFGMVGCARHRRRRRRRAAC